MAPSLVDEGGSCTFVLSDIRCFIGAYGLASPCEPVTLLIATHAPPPLQVRSTCTLLWCGWPQRTRVCLQPLSERLCSVVHS